MLFAGLVRGMEAHAGVDAVRGTEGQIEGAAYQGLGYALTEDLVVDGSTGAVLTGRRRVRREPAPSTSADIFRLNFRSREADRASTSGSGELVDEGSGELLRLRADEASLGAPVRRGGGIDAHARGHAVAADGSSWLQKTLGTVTTSRSAWTRVARAQRTWSGS